MNSLCQPAKKFSTTTIALTAIALLFAAAVLPVQAQTFTSLYTFPGPNGTPPGAYPTGLVQGTNGYLYGTGASNNGGIFKVSTSGAVTALYSFDGGLTDADGEAGYASLVQATNGSFYGTSQGNSGGCSGANGSCGVVYKITPGGVFTVVYDFCKVGDQYSSCADGTTTGVSLVQASNGDFYGTNQVFGDYNAGTIFKITPAGVLTTLHAFCANGGYEDCPDGAGAYSPLVQGTDGNLYGTTTYGGSSFFSGTAFKITQEGTFTTLHTFGTNGDLGALPQAALIQGADGNFYGTTAEGGTTNYGTFFTMTPSGVVTTLYSFCPTGNCPDGAFPGSLVLATDGNFYGGAELGPNGLGTIFQMTPSGVLTTVHAFNGADGENIYGNTGTLMQDTNGTFYGTSSSGGAGFPNCNYCAGTIWSLSMGLGPFVETLPTSGKVGTLIRILGTNLNGATSVSFNGVAATAFKVVSNNEITVTVPTGATTGSVKVVTPRRLLTSNVAFLVP